MSVMGRVKNKDSSRGKGNYLPAPQTWGRDGSSTGGEKESPTQSVERGGGADYNHRASKKGEGPEVWGGTAQESEGVKRRRKQNRVRGGTAGPGGYK